MASLIGIAQPELENGSPLHTNEVYNLFWITYFNHDSESPARKV